MPYLCKVEKGKKIILFDGVCNLCNNTVQFVIKRDKKDVFRFASIQSDVGQQLISERAINTTRVDSIILIEPEMAYFVRSDAALEIAYELGGWWKGLKLFELAIPRPLRDALYNWVARNRYRWFGKKNQCMIPTADLKAKFL